MTERLRILVADDDLVDRMAVRRALSATPLLLEVEEAGTCAQVLTALGVGAFDCVFLDFQFPDGDGLSIINAVRATGNDVPIIMLTGLGDELVAVELMKAGASDYLAKAKLTSGGLGQTLQNVLRVHRAELREREMATALSVSEARFRRVSETNVVGILFWNDRADITEANDAFLNLVGYTREDLEAGRLNWLAMTPPEHQAASMLAADHLRANGASATVEKDYIRKDGGRVSVIVSTSLLDGPVFQALSFILDVTARKRAERAQKFLDEIGRVVSGSLDYEETLERVAQLVTPGFADWCAVDLLEEDGVLRRVALSHVDPRKLAIAREIDTLYPTTQDSEVGIYEVINSGEALLETHVTDEMLRQFAADERHLSMLQDLGIASFLSAPLIARGRVIGAITFIGAESGVRFDAADLALAEEAARRVALSVDNSRLYVEARAQTAREVLVNAVGRKLRASLDAADILRAATSEVGRALGASRVLWSQLDDAQSVLVVSPHQYNAPGIEPLTMSYPLSTLRAGFLDAWTVGNPVVIHDTVTDSRLKAYWENPDRHITSRALLSCPIIQRGAWGGVLSVQQCGAPRRWTRDEVALVMAVSDLLGLALENARLYAREHRVADMLQTAFLTSIPSKLPGLRLATDYKAGLDEAHVGGDFYDALLLPDGRVAVVMADVSGKGLKAAVQTATVKYSLRAFAAEAAAPSLVLTRLNRALRGDSVGLGEHFVTLFYGVFDPASGRFVYANAGHETQLIKRISGGVTLLGANGPVLGVVNHRYEQAVEYLHPGDSVVLFTDGLSEARSSARELLEIDRIVEAVAAAPPKDDPSALVTTLVNLAMDWANNKPQDDLALMVIRRDENSVSEIDPDSMDHGSLVLEDAQREEPLFDFTFASLPDCAAEVRQALAHWMETLQFSQTEIEDFQTAVTEAVTNAVRHGSPRGAQDQFQVVGLRTGQDTLSVAVIDGGPGIVTPTRLPDMPEPEATGGRGLPLMRLLSDEVLYPEMAAGYCVKMVKRRK